MSYYVKPTFCPNYEDNQHYGYVSCMLKTWPDMWPEEMAAEGALYRERKRMQEQMFFMARDNVHRILHHFRVKCKKPSDIVKVALVSLADEQGWEVKNPDSIKYFGVSTIWKTSND